MNAMYTVFQIIHYIACACLIVVVLLQAGKSGGMAGIFGGGGSDQFLTHQSGKAFIKKVTIVTACVFVITSLILTKLSTQIGISSVINS
jgi:preprotein translocase subunit SecG